jgi:transposase-like protein
MMQPAQTPPTQQTSTFVCKECGRTFQSENALRAHMRSHKKKDPAVAVTETMVKPSTTQVNSDVVLSIMQMLEDGHTPIEIMQIHKIDVEQMKQILQEYRELKMLTMPEKSTAEAFIQIANIFGERIRDACDSYNDETGVCNEFSLFDIDPEFRRTFPGLFKGAGGKTRFHVGNNPWICVFCRRGIRRGE